MSADLERMGDLARHVARAARRRFPDSAVPAELRATIVEMGQVAELLVAKTGSVIATARRRGRRCRSSATTTRWTACTASCSARCSTSARRTASRRRSTSRWCRRYYERFADHAVAVARRVVFLVTGQQPQDLTESV